MITLNVTNIEHAFIQHRAALLRFLVARGAGDAAEDILHETWLRVSAGPQSDLRSPLSYFMQVANRLMIDRYRSRVQAEAREKAWFDSGPGVAEDPLMEGTAERIVSARQSIRLVEKVLSDAGERAAAIFRRHRIDAIPQREIAQEFGVSLSTVESDLRRCYAALVRLKEQIDEA